MNRKRTTLRGLAAAGIAASAVACGSAEEPARTTPLGKPVRESSAPVVGNQPPVIESLKLTPSEPAPGANVVALVKAADPERDPIQLAYEWRVDGQRTGSNSASLRLSGVSKGSLVAVTVTPRDDESQGASESTSIRVGNQAPVMLGIVIEPLGEVRANQDISASPRATDADGDELEYSFHWRVNGEEVDGRGPVLPSAHFERGDQIELTAVASDGSADSEPLASTPFPVVNAPPKIASTPGAIGEDGVFRYAVTAEDPDGDRMFRYRLTKGPEGMQIDVVSGMLTWSPGGDQIGAHPVLIEVDDRNGGTGTQSFEVRVDFEGSETPAAPAP